MARNTFHFLSKLTCVCVLSLSTTATFADSTDDLIELVQSLQKRVEKLESENKSLTKALDEPYISDEEPEISARVKALESQVNSYRAPINNAAALDGISAEGSLTIMSQSLYDNDSSASGNDSELNYRGDFAVTLPAGDLGNASGKFFAHIRAGQGLGLENPNGAFSSINGTSFQRPGAETSDSTLLLAEAWYQLDIPMPFGGNPGLSKQHLEFNIGKIDPFVFFDQNNGSDDETRNFINQSLIHNPLLDTGGDIGADEFGFTPGLRVAYVDESKAPASYTYSVGVFGSGKGASFEDSLSSPFVIAQIETEQNLLMGYKGGYRLYYWHNGRGVDFDELESTHSGLGFSFDQRIADYMTLLGRYGYQVDGRVAFDKALTLGLELGGSYWKRGADALGIAFGQLTISDEFAQQSVILDNGNIYLPSGSERLFEVYYRYHFNNTVETTLNWQHIVDPGGNQNQSAINAAGLKLQLNF